MTRVPNKLGNALRKVCLEATDLFDVDHPQIRAVAASLTAEAASESERAVALFDFVRDQISYDLAPDLGGRADWRASRTLERGTGFCQQKAILLATLARAVGIPAQISFQVLFDHLMPQKYAALMGTRELNPHGLAILYLNGRWVQLDPSLDTAACLRHNYHIVKFAGSEDALLPQTNLAGHPHFTLQEELGYYPELPDWVYRAMMSSPFLQSQEWKRLCRREGAVM